MAYLRQGITWIPDYTLKVLDDDTAELTLRGTLVNEAEDLIHSDVHLVVGVPHFVHTGYLAPLAVGQVIRSIGAAVGNLGVPAGVQSQIMNQAAVVNDNNWNGNTAPQFDQPGIVERAADAGGGNLARAVGNLPQLDGAAATDYTVYTKNDLTLRRGEKAILTLFVKKIKYTHIYRWSPPAAMEHSLVLLEPDGFGLDHRPLPGPERGPTLERRPAEVHAQGRPRRTAGHHGDQRGQRQVGTRGRSQAQGLFAAEQRQLRPGHAGRQAEVPQL